MQPSLTSSFASAAAGMLADNNAPRRDNMAGSEWYVQHWNSGTTPGKTTLWHTTAVELLTSKHTSTDFIVPGPVLE